MADREKQSEQDRKIKDEDFIETNSSKILNMISNKVKQDIVSKIFNIYVVKTLLYYLLIVKPCHDHIIL